ncbi:hypothetical protein [Cupriavidus basilensis]|uniref:hypothetical protein n=1 Tax=Cupriavidus basilensis TaxID=68895 RepID=UPI0007511F78|nr:hypothetical protein [Cupriavidus basilensis]
MGSFFGDGVKREDTSSNVSTTTTTTSNTDNRMVNDGGSVGINGTGNVVTDNGAVNAAFDFAKTSTETSYKSTADAIGLARDGLKMNLDQSAINAKGFLDSMGKLLDTAKSVNETATSNVAQAYSNVQEISTGQKFMVAGALCIAGIVAVKSMGKG